MWIKSSSQMPHDLEVVIGLYVGDWPSRGRGGIIDVYAYDGRWFNLPEGVDIVGWMPIPDTSAIYPPADSASGQRPDSPKLIGTVETTMPDVLECIFEGDFSPIDTEKDML